MLLWLMIVCAVGVILLLALGAFNDYRDVWIHPEHRNDQDDPHNPKPRLK